VTPEQIGRSLRALRLRKGWRQDDLGRRVGIGQSAVSATEGGDLDAVSARTLGRLFGEVGADLVLAVRWRGGELDRLLDRAHAELVERIAALLLSLGWQVHVEVSFARYGERGSVDVFGWHPSARVALIVEVKSEITGVEETLRRHDVKVRLAPHIAFDRLGERPAEVARLLVLPDTSTTRRRLQVHATTFGRAYPLRTLGDGMAQTPRRFDVGHPARPRHSGRRLRAPPSVSRATDERSRGRPRSLGVAA
jgi:transcriptional regulator with XRE-family HTH domain